MQCAQEKPTDYCDHGSAVSPWSGSVDFENDDIELITLGRGRRQNGQITIAIMRTVRQQGTADPILVELHSARVNLLLGVLAEMAHLCTITHN